MTASERVKLYRQRHAKPTPSNVPGPRTAELEAKVAELEAEVGRLEAALSALSNGTRGGRRVVRDAHRGTALRD